MGLAEMFEKIAEQKRQPIPAAAAAPRPVAKPTLGKPEDSFTGKDLSPTEVAVLVRKELRNKFPGAQISVKTSKYSGGSSIHVDWTDGPAYDAVNNLVKHMHGADVDAMQDMKVYNSSRFGNDFIFCQRRYSDEAYRKAGLEAAKACNIPVPLCIMTDKLLAIWVPDRRCNLGELARKTLDGTAL